MPVAITSAKQIGLRVETSRLQAADLAQRKAWRCSGQLYFSIEGAAEMRDKSTALSTTFKEVEPHHKQFKPTRTMLPWL